MKALLFCPLLLVRQRSLPFAAYQQRLLLVEAGYQQRRGFICLFHNDKYSSLLIYTNTCPNHKAWINYPAIHLPV
jgi:hypothetical protein